LEKINIPKKQKAFAIDPSNIDFYQGNITITAQGNRVMKCKEWNFSTQECYGDWVLVETVKPGENYTIILTQDDPAFVEIFIKTAIHLDENRTFVEDIYDFVKARDQNWTTIPESHYIRISFEKNLTSDKDITIYARSNNSGSVEVYEKNGTEKIADFGTINGDQKYQIFLTNLTGSQDVFDLKVVGGSVEFDYIVDPTIS